VREEARTSRRAGSCRATRSGMLNAHPSRALVCSEWLDPAMIDERQPFERDNELDVFEPANDRVA